MKKLFTLFAMCFAALTMSAENPVWTANGAYSYYPEDWDYDNTNVILVGNKGVKAECYSDYVVIHDWCGVEGYDLAVELGAYDETYGYYAITSICNITGEDWGEEKIVTVDNINYFVVQTGKEDYPYARISKDYSYFSHDLPTEEDSEDEEDGFYADIILNMDLGSDANFTTAKAAEIYLVWPEEEAVTKLPEDDAVLLYTSTGKATFKDVTLDNVTVEVYDMLVLVKAFAGVEDYNLKIFYGEDGAITKVNPNPATTGREDAYDSFYIYAAPSYPTYSTLTLGAESGGASLSAYLDSSYKTYGSYKITWSVPAEGDAIAAIKTQHSDAATYNLSGQRVEKGYKGIVVHDGKKMLIK